VFPLRVPPRSAGAESLIPMTGSLFVHGTVKTSAKLLVDVGAGFYVGKSTTAAVDILGRKVRERRGAARHGPVGGGVHASRKACLATAAPPLDFPGVRRRLE